MGSDLGRPRIVVATRSAHKLRELRELLHLSRTGLVSLDDVGVADEPVEDGATFEDNARKKAAHAARASGLWAVGEDSGLCVDALGGAPGVRSARYAGVHGDDAANNARLLRELPIRALGRQGTQRGAEQLGRMERLDGLP